MFQTYLDVVKTALEGFMNDKYQPFIEAFRPLAVLILTTYILISAIMIFTGKTEKPKEMLWTALTAFVITGIVFNYDVYKSWLIDPIINLSFRLMAYFLSEGGYAPSAVFAAIDAEFARLFFKIEKIAESVGWFNSLHISLVSFLLAMLYGALYIIFSVMIIASLFAMYVFFVIGGIPLFLAIMPSTRFIFWAWLRGVINYALIPVFVSIVMAIFLAMISAVTNDLQILDGNVWNYTVGSTFFVGFLAIYFVFKCSEFAAALTGGQPSSIGGFIGSSITIGALSAAGAIRSGVYMYANRQKLGSAAAAPFIAAKDFASAAYSRLKGIFRK
jgi:type IV secretory pathway VirB6-like protein